jgi:hypothetical protein
MTEPLYLFRVYDRNKDQYTMSVEARNWEDAYFEILQRLGLDVTVMAGDYEKLRKP